jgi:hypothetical protein
VNSGLDRLVTIRSIVAQGRPGHDAADLILVAHRGLVGNPLRFLWSADVRSPAQIDNHKKI